MPKHFDSRDVQSTIALHSKCLVAECSAPCVTIKLDSDNFHQLQLYLGNPAMHKEIAEAMNAIARKHRYAKEAA